MTKFGTEVRRSIDVSVTYGLGDPRRGSETLREAFSQDVAWLDPQKDHSASRLSQR